MRIEKTEEKDIFERTNSFHLSLTEFVFGVDFFLKVIFCFFLRTGFGTTFVIISSGMVFCIASTPSCRCFQFHPQRQRVFSVDPV